jgi:hypothetical protein
MVCNRKYTVVLCGYTVDIMTVKAKKSHYKPMEAQGERRYSPYSFMTSALEEREWSAS